MKPIPCTNTGENICFEFQWSQLLLVSILPLCWAFSRIPQKDFGWALSKWTQILAQQGLSALRKGQLLLKICTHEYIGIKLYRAENEVQWEKEPSLLVLLQYKSQFFGTWAQTFPCLLLNDAWTDYRPKF